MEMKETCTDPSIPEMQGSQAGVGRGRWTDHTKISGIPHLEGTRRDLCLRGRELLGVAGESQEFCSLHMVVSATKVTDLLSSSSLPEMERFVYAASLLILNFH